MSCVGSCPLTAGPGGEVLGDGLERQPAVVFALHALALVPDRVLDELGNGRDALEVGGYSERCAGLISDFCCDLAVHLARAGLDGSLPSRPLGIALRAP